MTDYLFSQPDRHWRNRRFLIISGWTHLSLKGLGWDNNWSTLSVTMATVIRWCHRLSTYCSVEWNYVSDLCTGNWLEPQGFHCQLYISLIKNTVVAKSFRTSRVFPLNYAKLSVGGNKCIKLFQVYKLTGSKKWKVCEPLLPLKYKGNRGSHTLHFLDRSLL